MKDKNRLVPIHIGDGSPIVTRKYDRNAQCKCGSGKKQKHCCGVKTEFYSTKPKRVSPDQSNYIEKAVIEKYGSDIPENSENAVTNAAQNT